MLKKIKEIKYEIGKKATELLYFNDISKNEIVIKKEYYENILSYITYYKNNQYDGVLLNDESFFFYKKDNFFGQWKYKSNIAYIEKIFKLNLTTPSFKK